MRTFSCLACTARPPTKSDVALWGGVAHQTVSARFSEMKRDGDLIAIGVTRKTRKNCNAAVYVARGVWEEASQGDGRRRRPSLLWWTQRS